MKNLAGTIGLVSLIVAVANLVIYAGLAYIVASAVTSGVKAFNNQCGTAYGVEKFVDGDWFCAE